MAYTKISREYRQDWEFHRLRLTDPWERTSVKRELLRRRTGDRNLKWKDQVHDGSNATTAMSGEFSRFFTRPTYANHCFWWDKVGGTSEITSVQGEIASTQAGTSPPPISTNAQGKAQTQAYMKALKEIREMQRAFQGGVFFGELRETLRMLRRPAESLFKGLGGYLQDVKRLKRVHPSKYKDMIAGTWLEYVFGWRPLVHDIQDAVKAYQRLHAEQTRTPWKHFSVGHAEKDPIGSSVSSGFFSPVAGGYLTFRYSDVLEAESICRIQGVVKRQVEMTTAEKWQLFGFSAGEFAPTVWELIPWSFLVDYFVNVGDLLEAVTTDVSSVAWTNRTTIDHTRRSYICWPDDRETARLAGKWHIYTNGGSSHAIWDRRLVTRDPAWSIGSASPQLSLTFPGLGSQRWLNMSALFAQAVSIHPQKFNGSFRGR